MTCCPKDFREQGIRRLLVDNALETYPRLREEAVVGDNAARSEETVR